MSRAEPRVRGYRTASQLIRSIAGTAALRAIRRDEYRPPRWASEGPIPPAKECQWREPEKHHTEAPCGLPSMAGYSFCEAHKARVYVPRGNAKEPLVPWLPMSANTRFKGGG